MMNILELKNLNKSYKNGDERLEIIKDMNFSLEAGKQLIITGESGCGKSTLLNIIGSLDFCDSGSVIVNGTDITKLGKKGLFSYRNSTIGFIFQFHYLLKELNALENIMIPALISGIPKKEAREMGEELLERVNMIHKRNSYPSRLSGGERQRIAVARALVNNPMLILADEPTGNLDEKNSRNIENLLFELTAEKGKSLILVTHDPGIAARGDITVKLENGGFVQI